MAAAQHPGERVGRVVCLLPAAAGRDQRVENSQRQGLLESVLH